jgi:glycosyltransferase involved in cell wall biosynthesis
MRVVLSSGVGRIHFVETALALKRAGVLFEFVCGYIPKPKHSAALNLIGRFLGRPRLYERLLVRLGGGDLRSALRANALAEGVAQLLYRLGQLHLCPMDWGQRLSWQLFGYRTRRYLRNQQIFHVRSGAGQGGAIRTARRRGMRIVVDHSIAHPAYINDKLAGEYRRVARVPLITPTSAFWRLVLADCAMADVLVVNSDFVKSTFIERGYPAHKITVDYLGVREDFLGIKKDYRRNGVLRLLFIGSFELRKGARILVEALELLKSRGLGVELHLVGDASEGKGFFRERLKNLPVVFHGAILQDKVRELLINSDIFIFPTFAEGCAKAAMEALVAGLPVITTCACGLPIAAKHAYVEVIDGDAIQLAKEIQRLGDDELLREDLGRSGAKIGANYTWSKYGERLAKLYKDCLKSS